MIHDLRTITDPPRPLHIIEVVLVAAVTANDNHVRVCGCGMLLVGRDELEVRARHTEHARLAAVMDR